MPVDMNSVTTNDCRQLEVSFCCAINDVVCFGAPTAGCYKWQYILIATFSGVIIKTVAIKSGLPQEAVRSERPSGEWIFRREGVMVGDVCGEHL